MNKLKSKDYLNFLSNYPCVVTGKHSVTLHHESVVRKFWASQKKNFDFGALPLDHRIHIDERHGWGRETFWTHYNINPLERCIFFVKAYIADGGIDSELAEEALVLLINGYNT